MHKVQISGLHAGDASEMNFIIWGGFFKSEIFFQTGWKFLLIGQRNKADHVHGFDVVLLGAR